MAGQLLEPSGAPAGPGAPGGFSRTPGPPVGAGGGSGGGKGGSARHNPFSPSRTETPQGPAAGVTQFPRPYLYGIVLTQTARIAYFEDPVTKRLAGYRVGDALIGGTLQRIDAEHVVIARPDGPVDVHLRDPGKPRSGAVATGPLAGAPGLPPVPSLPSQMPSSGPSAPPQLMMPQ